MAFKFKYTCEFCGKEKVMTEEQAKSAICECEANIDLNNTWCEATEENYKALLPLVYTQYINLSQLGKGSFYIKSDNTAYFSINLDTPNIRYKKISLVNGKFEFVKSDLKI